VPSASVVARLSKANPGVRVIHRDLTAVPIPHLSGAAYTLDPNGSHPWKKLL
jgi:FMN-dependent NADH-azoreductase